MIATARRRPKRRGTDAPEPRCTTFDTRRYRRRTARTTRNRRRTPPRTGNSGSYAGEPADSIYIVDSGRFVAVAPEGHVLLRWHRRLDRRPGGTPGLPAQRCELCETAWWRIAAETFTELAQRQPRYRNRRCERGENATPTPRRLRRPRVIGARTGTPPQLMVGVAAPLDSNAVIAPVETTSAVQRYDELVEAFSEALDRAGNGGVLWCRPRRRRPGGALR